MKFNYDYDKGAENALVMSQGAPSDDGVIRVADVLEEGHPYTEENRDVLRAGIETGNWELGSYYWLVRAEDGEGFYPLPLVFSNEETEKNAPSIEWKEKMRGWLRDAVNQYA